MLDRAKRTMITVFGGIGLACIVTVAIVGNQPEPPGVIRGPQQPTAMPLPGFKLADIRALDLAHYTSAEVIILMERGSRHDQIRQVIRRIVDSAQSRYPVLRVTVLAQDSKHREQGFDDMWCTLAQSMWPANRRDAFTSSVPSLDDADETWQNIAIIWDSTSYHWNFMQR